MPVGSAAARPQREADKKTHEATNYYDHFRHRWLPPVRNAPRSYSSFILGHFPERREPAKFPFP